MTPTEVVGQGRERLGKPSPKQQETAGRGGRAETRARLLQAAKATFEEKGFLATRVSDIAKRAGASHGLFYNYFDSKQDVFREIAAQVDQELAQILYRPGGPEDLEARWLEAVRLFFEIFRREARIMRVIEEVSRYDPEIQARRRARHKKESRHVAAAIAILQAEGRADPGLDPEVTAIAIGALIWRFSEQWFVWGELDCGFEEGLDQYTRIMMNALRFRTASVAETPVGRPASGLRR